MTTEMRGIRTQVGARAKGFRAHDNLLILICLIIGRLMSSNQGHRISTQVVLWHE
jgi:hypothetical protein